MREKARDEGVWLKRTVFDAAALGFGITEGHVVVGQLLNSIVRECDAEDVRGQIFQRCLATADPTTIDHPGLCPSSRADFPIQRCLAQRRPELSPKQLRERFAMHEKGSPPDDPSLPIGRKREGRNQIMDVWMVAQVARPGLQHTEHTNLSTQEAWILGELLQSCGGGAKEQRIDRARVLTCQRSQTSGQREG